MKLVHELLHTLNSKERDAIRTIIKSESAKNANKTLMLFDIFCSAKDLPEKEELASSIYASTPDTRLTKLISRLENKIYDAVIDERFISASRLFPAARERVHTRKRFATATALNMLCGTSPLVGSFTDKLIATMEESSLIPLIELYSIKRSFTVQDPKLFDYCTDKINFYWKCYQLYTKLDHSYSLIIQNDAINGAGASHGSLKTIKSAIEAVKRTPQYLINFNGYRRYFYLQIEYYVLLKKYEMAKRVVIKAAGFFNRKWPHKAFTARLKTVYADCEIMLGNYENAIKYFRAGMSVLYKEERHNYLITLFHYIQPLIYTKRLAEAREVISEMERGHISRPDDLRFSKYIFFKAYIAFIEMDYKITLQILSVTSKLNQDKIGHDFFIRLLRVQSFIMLNQFDEASAAIHALRKHVSRYEKKFYISPRSKSILKVLLLAERRGFTGPVKKTERDLIAKLRLKKGAYAWQPLTNELIRFEEWYDNSPLSQ